MIWRPFHEMQGNWFWWGTTWLDDPSFIQLWIYAHNYLTNTKGLDNLLWVYAGNEYLSRYPGAAYVDLVGQDLYSDDPTSGSVAYQAMLATGTLPRPPPLQHCYLQYDVGKPVVISEFGPQGPSGGGDPSFQEPTLIAAIKSTMPKSLFWQQWWDGNAGAPGWGMAECQNVQAALDDPWVLNRNDLALVNKYVLIFSLPPRAKERRGEKELTIHFVQPKFRWHHYRCDHDYHDYHNYHRKWHNHWRRRVPPNCVRGCG